MKNVLRHICFAGVLTGSIACTQEQIIETNGCGAITFDYAFVDNTTRANDPSTTTDDLTEFDVWGFVKESNGTVFTDKDVVLDGTGWAYEGTQYWAPKQPYYFSALSPMNSANVTETLATGEDAKLGLGTVTFENIDGTEDLLYARYHVVSKDLNMQNDPVSFQFQHLLAKVKFTFNNSFTTDNLYAEVKNIRMSAPKKASINLAQSDYSKGWIPEEGEEVVLNFGNTEKIASSASGEAEDRRLTIPTGPDYLYDISFDIVIYASDLVIYETSKTSAVTGLELEMGKAYNFTTDINPTNIDLALADIDVVEIPDID